MIIKGGLDNTELIGFCAPGWMEPGGKQPPGFQGKDNKNNMFRIAVCEDSKIAVREIRSLLNAYNEQYPELDIRVGFFVDGKELLGCVAEGQVFDLFLLDIMMPGQDGIEIARELREKKEEAPLVFLTSSADYALAAFSVKAMQYLMKPVQKETLFPVLDEILEQWRKEKDDFFLVETSKRKVKLRYSSIICVESFYRTLMFYLIGGEKLTSKTIRVPIDIAVAPLLEDNRFLHAHKSYIVNMAHVEELTGSSFIMKNGMEVSIPRYKYVDAKTRYLTYLSQSDIGLLGGI